MTAPSETPLVNPEFTRPIIRPRRFLFVNSMTRIMDRMLTPAAPVPVITRPKRKKGREVARDATNEPMANMVEETSMHNLGGKILDRRPASGATLDAAI